MTTHENLPTTGATAAAQAMLTENKVSPTTGGGLPYLRFDSKRTGEWLFGRDAEACTGEEFSLDLTSLKHGQILWHNKKANRQMVPINTQLPEPQEPIHWTDNKGQPQVDEASEARSFEGVFADGTRFEMETSTFGGRKAVDAMLAELFLRAQQGNPYLFPVVTLASDSYDHQQYGLVYEPVLECTRWYDEAGNEEGEEPAKIEAPKKAAKKRKPKAAAPEVEEEEVVDTEPMAPEEEEAPAPTRRRQRRRS